VRHANPSQRRTHTLLAQEELTCWFVLPAASFELGRMKHLSGVVKYDANSNELRVEWNSEPREPCQEKICRLADQFYMAEQSLRGAELTEQNARSRDGRWVQRVGPERGGARASCRGRLRVKGHHY
jgi:hypothetical protein